MLNYQRVEDVWNWLELDYEGIICGNIMALYGIIGIVLRYVLGW